jgi:Type I phosphodiesterase / nucleotide pyrophosphatase
VRRTLRSPWLFAIALLAGAVVSLLVVDGVNPPRRRAELGVVRVDSTRTSRVLILLIDSWRHETALDSSIMPNTTRLSRDGASGKIETVFEGFSIPAIRAAFSGSAETQLMNLIRNFHFRALPTESAFLDARRLGKRTLVVGDDPFTQFGPVLEKRLPTGPNLDMYGLDRLRSGIALDAYENETWDIVVCHEETGDWRAHQYGVHSPRYAEAFAYEDSIIAAFARARRPNDYLIVFGDHGHDDRGEHKTGLYIPAHGLFIGPDIRPGVVFPSMPIGDVRAIVDHALGIELRVPSREAQRLSQFIPGFLPGPAVVNEASAGDSGPSRSVTDYLLFVLFLAAGLAATAVATSGGTGERAGEALAKPVNALSVPLIVLLFCGELLLQLRVHPAWSVFPFLILVVGALLWRTDWRRGAIVLAIGVFFASRYSFDSASASLLRIPFGVSRLIPLYAAGTAAKLAMLLAITGRKRWLAAVIVATLLALIEFRVWDYPAVYLAAIAIASIAAVALRAEEHAASRRLAFVALSYVTLYFTLRLPIYQYAWVDFFLLGVCLASRAAPSAWLDAMVITGAFALTSVWLPGGLEWGFLYGMFPAYVIELHVGWFVPIILLKLPLLLVLAWLISDTRPSRRFVLLMFAYAGIRFIAVWMIRLMGGSGAELWPMAEQGIYLVPFAIATVWFFRGGESAHERSYA